VTTLSVRSSFAYPGGFRLNADFEAGPGITALVGPSGGGKSTLVSLIAGLIRPDTGSIAFAGRTFADSASGTCVRPERRRVGVAFQDGRLFPHLSVRRNLLYGRRRFGTARPAYDGVVAALDLRDLLGRRPDALSGGQRQRVALGRALLTGADLLLLDEPVSALDPALRNDVLDFLRETVTATGATCLVVSHETATVERLAAAGVIPVVAGEAAGV
jgi:molybdate transport system ATP-binding protein